MRDNEPTITLLPTCAEIEASRKAWDSMSKGVSGYTISISEERITEIFRSMPGGVQGFCKTWGYLTFAKCLLLNQLHVPDGSVLKGEPDQFCVTDGDGSCISTDPRCMHNKHDFSCD